ncbi:MAG TPA: phospholipase D family protein [Polyangiaceae bacterium]
MLAPDTRSLYVDAVRPPIGYKFDEAIACTYSVDLTTLLTVPLSLALPHLDVRRLGKQSAITLLDAIRRVAGRVTVYANQGQIAAPSGKHLLYGLLEPVIIETRAPLGGAQHAKFWVLRYESEEQNQPPVFRLFVTSRNLTADRCWDIALQLDGKVTGRNHAFNKPLVELLTTLPTIASRGASALALALARAQAQAARLSDELRRVDWELPVGFDDISFHVLGLKRKEWLPAASQQLVAISPFVSADALQKLKATTRGPVTLISRSEELDKLPHEVLSSFDRIRVLHQAAESEDGEDQDAHNGLSGLHAKVYVAKQGWDTSLYLGSANATDGALLYGCNVELLVELSGKTSKVGGVDTLLGTDGLGHLLVDYVPSPTPNADPDEVAAQQALESFRKTLLQAPLAVHFTASPTGLQVTLAVEGSIPEPDGIHSARAWLVTADPSSAATIEALWNGGAAELGTCAPASATGLVAFELQAAQFETRLTFTLNLPVVGMPADRDAQVLRVIVDNKDRFLEYLRALLDGVDGEPLPSTDAEEDSLNGGCGATLAHLDAGLLEQLVRTKARAPERLVDIQRLVATLSQTPEGAAIIPDDFKRVWSALSEEDS